MPENNIEVTDQFKATSVLTIYECNQTINEDGREVADRKTYVEVHSVDQRGNVLSGKPLTHEFANTLGKSLFKNTRQLISGVIPRNLIFLGWNNDMPVMVWHTPIQKVKAFYAEVLNIPNGEIHVPALVWKYDYYHGGLNLFALDKEFVDEKQTMYNAPFHNIGGFGGVCLGSASSLIRKNPNPTYKSIIQEVERIFWNTEFSHSNNGQIVKGNINSLHKKLVEGKPFPLESLQPLKSTIETLCK